MQQRAAWSPGQRLLTAGLVFMVTAVAFEGLAVPTVMPATLDGALALSLVPRMPDRAPPGAPAVAAPDRGPAL